MTSTNAIHTTAALTDNKTQDTAPVDLAVANDPRFQVAYSGLLARAQALPESELLQINLDVPTTATTCIAVGRRMAQHRGFFAALKLFDVENLDGLEAAGLALAAAQADYRAAITPPDSLNELIERGAELRSEFQLWGEALAKSGVISAAKPEAIRGGASHRDTAMGLLSWVRTYRGGDWARIQRVSVLTDAMLTEGEAIAQRILAVVGDRDLHPERVATAADLRQRMFTLAVRRYDQVRRGTSYLRWNEGDVDEFVPSLFARGPRKPENDDEKEKDKGKGEIEKRPAGGGATPITPPADPNKTPARPPVDPDTRDDDGPNSRPFINR